MARENEGDPCRRHDIMMMKIIRSGRLAEIWCFVCVLKSQRILWLSFFLTNYELCVYHLFVWSNLKFLHNSQWITLPTESWLVLYSFCDNLLHSLIWLIISPLSPHNLHILFRCVLSILALIWRCFVLLLKEIQFAFLSHVNIFSCKMSLVSRLKGP